MVKTSDDLFPDIPSEGLFLDNCPAELPTPDEVRRHHDVLREGIKTVARFLERRLVVKYGRVRESEFYSQWLVSMFTAAPTPAVYAYLRESNSCAFMYMELVEGVTLDTRWPSLSTEDRQLIAHSLSSMLDGIRRDIELPEDWYIGAVPRKPCTDGTLWNLGPGDIGPISCVAEFHDQLVTMGLYPGRPALPNDPRELRKVLPDDARVVFTHNNLHFTNILVSSPGEELAVRAIIDWENSGFYPDYWEWVEMMTCEGRAYVDRVPFIDAVCLPHPEIWSKWDDWLYDLHM